MTTSYPVATNPVAVPEAPSPGTTAPASPASGSWRYAAARRPRGTLVAAGLLSAGLHAGLLLGFIPERSKPAPPKEEHLIQLRLAMPDIKDLEEPEPAADDNGQAVDLGTLVPMQQDVPQLARPQDFVQQINFASLMEQPDFSQMKVYVIPEHIRSGGNLAERIGKIFNLEDLDRVPTPVLQPAPVYPVSLRREGLAGNVVVEFIVDANGYVLNPVVVDTTDRRFDEAALAGVSKWKFRAGLKAGKKVNTRMRVPIVFKVLEGE